MREKKEYKNGQKVYELTDDYLIYYFEDGTVKSRGPYINQMMEGEWEFFRKTGQLWQVGHFKANQKHGRWLRYNKEDQLEYDSEFSEGKQVRK